jgi:phage FluMu gp28-like protein
MLLEYQRKWILDEGPLKICVKARQIGYSWVAALRAVIRCVERPNTEWVLLSRGQRQSLQLMNKVQEHVRAFSLASETFRAPFGVESSRLEVRFDNGSVIYGLPANPDTARGYTANITLDEFAFHQDADKLYTALYPSITQGFCCEIISTPNGQQGKFYELARQAGLVDGFGDAGSPWHAHMTDIDMAIAQGFGINPEVIRAGCDEETWAQEYQCQFISTSSMWIPPELITASTDEAASCELSGFDRNLYAGWDIARNRDLSVLWLLEQVGDVTWTRGVIVFRNVPTPDQIRDVDALMPRIKRLTIDRSGMGLVIAEHFERKYAGRAESVQFTNAVKEELATKAKSRMLEGKVRLPDDPLVRASFRSVKRSITAAGLTRFDAEHDAKSGHADHWWAFALAEAAAEAGHSMYSYARDGSGGCVGKPIFAGIRSAVL